jgi:hypothetical protein
VNDIQPTTQGGEPAPDRPVITADWSLTAVLARVPSTGVVFAQHGPLFKVQRGQIYPTFPELTVREWADANHVPLDALLVRLDAHAEGEEGARRSVDSASPHEPRPRPGWARTTIGYTGSFDERGDVEVDSTSVVAEQARGPG